MTLLATRFDPFQELATLRNRMDRLFNRLPEEWEEPVMTGNWMPATDIHETKDSLVVKAEIPGMEEKDINVEVENNTLTISGERKFETKVEEKDFRRIERSYGKFLRAFTLPPNVDTTKINATYLDGILQLTIPKKEEAKPKKIQLEVKKALTTPKAA